MRVSYPTSSLDGYNLIVTENGDKITRKGAFQDLINKLVTDYSITLEAQSVTDKSLSIVSIIDVLLLFTLYISHNSVQSLRMITILHVSMTFC